MSNVNRKCSVTPSKYYVVAEFMFCLRKHVKGTKERKQKQGRN